MSSCVVLTKVWVLQLLEPDPSKRLRISEFKDTSYYRMKYVALIPFDSEIWLLTHYDILATR